ncbi:MAG: alternative ribosome rescue aminoacyl-tRNA hydrolase ArfB [Planctomycetota bacterium]
MDASQNTTASDLFVHATLTIPAKDLRYSASRSSGPGGQNVNKVNSKVTLKWNPTQSIEIPNGWKERFKARFAGRINREGDFVLQCDEYRDWHRNLMTIRFRLKSMLLETRLAPKKRRPTKPSRASQRRRLDAKKRHSQKKRERGQSW